MAYILNIETSTTNCSVALAHNGELRVLKEDNALNYSHSERLHVYIEEVLESAQISSEDLQAVAVSQGPGSYTGLRIGVSAAKGLCFALDLPLISVPTLEVLSRQVLHHKGYIVPMLDARRMEVYTTIFDDQYNIIEPTSAKILETNSFESQLKDQQVYFIGNAVEKASETILHNNAHFVEAFPSAKQMCGLSFKKFQLDEVEDLAYFEPYYLKDFIGTPSK